MSDVPSSLSVEASRALSQSMQNGQARLEVLTRNAANVQTPGYLRQIPFVQQLDAQSQAQGQLGPAVSGTTAATANPSANQPNPLGMSGVQVGTDFRPGALRATGNPLDVALIGPVFVEVDVAAGTANQTSKLNNTRHWVKGGQWQIDANGVLKTNQGHVVLGAQGPIVLSTPNPSIDAQGQVFEHGKPVAKLQLWQADADNPLTHARLEADGTWRIPTSALRQVVTTDKSQTLVRQGFLEASNVSSAVEMTELIRVMRQYEANQKIMQMRDDMLDKTLNQLGQF